MWETEGTAWADFIPFTKRDLPRVAHVDGSEQMRHAEPRHPQGGLQDDGQLHLRDGSVLLGLKHLEMRSQEMVTGNGKVPPVFDSFACSAFQVCIKRVAADISPL